MLPPFRVNIIIFSCILLPYWARATNESLPGDWSSGEEDGASSASWNSGNEFHLDGSVFGDHNLAEDYQIGNAFKEIFEDFKKLRNRSGRRRHIKRWATLASTLASNMLGGELGAPLWSSSDWKSFLTVEMKQDGVFLDWITNISLLVEGIKLRIEEPEDAGRNPLPPFNPANHKFEEKEDPANPPNGILCEPDGVAEARDFPDLQPRVPVFSSKWGNEMSTEDSDPENQVFTDEKILLLDLKQLRRLRGISTMTKEIFEENPYAQLAKELKEESLIKLNEEICQDDNNVFVPVAALRDQLPRVGSEFDANHFRSLSIWYFSDLRFTQLQSVCFDFEIKDEDKTVATSIPLSSLNEFYGFHLGLGADIVHTYIQLLLYQETLGGKGRHYCLITTPDISKASAYRLRNNDKTQRGDNDCLFIWPILYEGHWLLVLELSDVFGSESGLVVFKTSKDIMDDMVMEDVLQVLGHVNEKVMLKRYLLQSEQMNQGGILILWILRYFLTSSESFDGWIIGNSQKIADCNSFRLFILAELINGKLIN